MKWTETSPGVFTSEFGGAEKIYRRISLAYNHLHKEHWGIHCVCRLSFGPAWHQRNHDDDNDNSNDDDDDDVATALREAWKTLMITFPGLSVVPDGLLTKVYTVLNPVAVERWVQETFFVEPVQTADTVIANAEPRDWPSLYYLPSSDEIVFLSSHWRTDAVGTCVLLNHLFSVLAQQQQQQQQQQHIKSSLAGQPELDKLSPSLEDAAGSPETGTPALQAYARQFIDNLHQKAIHAGGLPYNGDGTTPPTRPTHQDLILTRDSTRTLIAACKNRNISVSAAIHTALAHTVFSFTPEDSDQSDDDDYTTIMAVNMRGYLLPPYNTSTAHPCQTYVASITPTVRRHADFARSTLELTRQYRSWYSDTFRQSLRWIYRFHAEALFSPPPKSAAAAAAVPPPKPPSGVTLSSLGVIEQYLSGDYYRDGDGDQGEGMVVRVDKFRFGVTMMTRQMLLYPWTFRGQLNLSVNYNEAYYDSDMARAVLLRIKGVLEKELELELGVAEA